MAWRSPWQGAPNFEFLDRTVLSCSAAFLKGAEKLGMSMLARFPAEIIDMIRCHLEGSLFCRYITVLDLVRELDEAAQNHITLSLPLAQVLR